MSEGWKVFFGVVGVFMALPIIIVLFTKWVNLVFTIMVLQ
jgi:hypothetical protein